MKADEAIQILKTWRITGDEAHEALDMAIEALAKDINVPINDCISRDEAIDALAIGEELLKRVLDDMDVVGYEREKYEWGLGLIESYISDMKELPSVQPEPLTDKEQRIFLAAMGREEKVCKQVDDECRDCREPYEDSLVRTCHEITRKVKGALWET